MSAGAGLLVALALASLGDPPSARAAGKPPIRFAEIGAGAGARHLHHLRRFAGEHAQVLEMFTAGGAAVAVGDYDGDGDDDLLLTDSDAGRPLRLLRHDRGVEDGPRFVDVALAAGVAGGNDAGSIVADALWLDADGDGWRDLLIVRFGTPILYRNLGDGCFADVTAGSGLERFANSIAAIAFDYDRDGRIDLLLGHYFAAVDLLALESTRILPHDLDAADNGGGVSLYRNVTAPGSAAIRFQDATAAAGLAHHTGWTLDAGHADLDGDGWPDLYLAVDYGTDRLFFNNRDGTFRDATATAIGFDTKKGMNVDFGDFDRDGRLDVYVTNITDEYMRECNMLWRNNGDGTFTDLAKETGACNTLWGWGAKFADFDNDGWEDLFAATGLRSAGPGNYIPILLEMLLTPGLDLRDARNWPAIGDASWSGHQKQKLLRNLEGQVFKEVGAEAGVATDLDGRGVGLLDLDDDGRLDFLQTNAGQPSLLFHNLSPGAGSWLELRLVGAGANRDAVGARVEVSTGGATWVREVNGGNGYASQSTTRLHFGLGASAGAGGELTAVDIRWPSGRRERRRLPRERVAVLVERPPDDPAARAERLQQHRNLGKAFYENPATQYQAVDEFRRALELDPDSARERLNHGLALLRAGKTAEGVAELVAVQRQDPSLPHTWFNLGVHYKREADYERAIAQFERMVELVPEEAVSRFNLGLLYRLEGRLAEGLPHLEAAARLDPNLAGPRFQLYNAYRQAGRPADAERELAAFEELRRRHQGAAVPEDLEWSWYAEIYDPLEPARESSFPEPAGELELEVHETRVELDPRSAGLMVLDADRDGRPDLLAWSARGAALLVGSAPGGATLLAPAAEQGDLAGLRGVRAVAAGDFDNDGWVDLAVVAAIGEEETGALVLRNHEGVFRRHPLLPVPGEFVPVWLDFDHEYDLDLLLFGERPRLLRNQGEAGFADETARFPFVPGRATAAVAFDLEADTQNTDLLVAYADRSGVLYRDRLGGIFEARELAEVPAGARALVALDFDHDGWTDLAAAGPAGLALLRNTQLEGLAALAGVDAAPREARSPIAFADLWRRGTSDLVAASGPWLHRGGARFAPLTVTVAAWPAAALAGADFDGDGRGDLAVVGEDGRLRLLRNRTRDAPGAGHWLEVALAGVKNPALAVGSEVEVKAGTLYQKKLYQGVPLHFGLGERTAVDALRITWPNGLIQNEARPEIDRRLEVREAPRLSGSCPMIFVWNGERFAFVTDVLGVAPLGASAGDGQYFPVDHDEVVQIPGEWLAPADGAFEVRITEELREVAYLDQIRLLAVDHPADVAIYTNDKFKGPPFPEFRLFGVATRVPPVRAVDHRGRDVRERLLRRDRVYPDGFDRDPAGVAELHHLTLDFGDAAPDGRALLVLSGWVDWADGSTFLAAAQESPQGLVMPYLEVRDENGEWRTVLADMGIPAGKPKTIVVDLSGKFLSASREVRITTSLCVYWDEIFLAPAAGEPEVVLAEVPALSQELRFRGFSRPLVHPQRRQPESFDYQSWMPASMWNQTPGLYTRYGDVAPLLAAENDLLVVMGSGDELRLRFDSTALPPPRAGWTRDFLLWVDGWAKDGDANTAHSQTVEPLPFHGMSVYPYPPGERFPDGETHRRWRAEYQTRPALRPLLPLRPRGPGAAPAAQP